MKQRPAPPPKSDNSRGAQVLEEAKRILYTEGARGWSDALKKASDRVK